MADDPADVLDREVRKALELNPNSAEGHNILGALAGSLGIVEAYVSQAEEAYRLDPLSPPTMRYLGNAYFYAGRLEDSLAHWKRVLEKDPRDAYRGMADYYMLKGDLDRAEAMVTELERITPSSEFAYLCRGYLAALRGDRQTALKVLTEFDRAYRAGDSRRSSLGFIYYALGDLDRFFECMFEAARAHTLQAARLRLSPLFAAVRSDPRFVELMSVYGRPVQAPR
jgi:tetratricopeptide (TPR) repeat protein